MKFQKLPHRLEFRSLAQEVIIVCCSLILIGMTSGAQEIIITNSSTVGTWITNETPTGVTISYKQVTVVNGTVNEGSSATKTASNAPISEKEDSSQSAGPGAFVWYSIREHRIQNPEQVVQTVVTLITVPQPMDLPAGSTWTFAPLELQQQTKAALQDYFNALDSTGYSGLYSGELEQNEHVERLSLEEAQRKVDQLMDENYQYALQIQGPDVSRVIVLFDPIKQKIVKRLSVPATPRPAIRKGAGAAF